MTKFQVDIVSDILCPWCYIGHARLTRAITTHLSTHPTDTFSLIYHPFYLRPPPPSLLASTLSGTQPFFPVQPPSRPRLASYAEKFGSERQALAIFDRLHKAAKQDGLDFKFGGNTGSSRNGHRLVRYAQRLDRERGTPLSSRTNLQNNVMLELWRMYFEREQDITELDILVDAGVKAGLGDKEQVRRYLMAEGDQREHALRDARDVDTEAEEAGLGGVSGVPFYEIGILVPASETTASEEDGGKEQGGAETLLGKYEVSGAQDPRLFGAVFEKFKELEEMKLKHDDVGKKKTTMAKKGQVDGKKVEDNKEENKALEDGEACAIDGSGKC